MKVTLVTIGMETDPHGSDIEMFRVYKDVDLLMEPKLKTFIKTKEGDKFFIETIEQDLKKEKIYLFKTLDIAHYEFWHKKEEFREKYLAPYLKREWSEKEL
jgi:hypothetical protein